MNIMYELPELVQGIIVKRPSANCKTPYVADVFVEENDETVMAHTPALGCCGLSDKTSAVYMSPVISKKNVCTYRVDLSILYEPKLQTNIIVGINPKLAENLVEHALRHNQLGFLKNTTTFVREFFIEGTHSRFDFVGVDASGKPFVMEVKNVPLADYVDCCAKERKKMDMTVFDDVPWNKKIAYFPDGYRKTAKEPVSPRALKHLYDLVSITKSYRTIMCYVIQREDVGTFQPSVIDETYRKAFYECQEKGVEMHAIQFKWDKNGCCELMCDDLPIS
tara:strand:+ start:5525 stop:6358 length:834 start_codon:yes stop_codon:yes gene_type:complete